MLKVQSAHASDRLRLLRKRSGLSMEALALACGYRTGSGYQRYEKATEFPSGFLPPEFVGQRLMKGLLGKGIPPVTKEEIWSLAESDFRPTASGEPLASSSESVTSSGEAGARIGKSRQAQFYELAKMLFETINKYNGNLFLPLQIETWSLTLARAEDTERFVNEGDRRRYIEDRVAEIVDLHPSTHSER